VQVLNGKEREVLEMLHGYGLCDYEAKAYFALLAVGESKAWDVARKAAIPPSKVHQTLGRLVERGFVERYSEERPAMYKANALKETTEKVVALRNREIAGLKRNKEKLSRVLEAVTPIHRRYGTYRLFAPRYRTWKKGKGKPLYC